MVSLGDLGGADQCVGRKLDVILFSSFQAAGCMSANFLSLTQVGPTDELLVWAVSLFCLLVLIWWTLTNPGS